MPCLNSTMVWFKSLTDGQSLLQLASGLNSTMVWFKFITRLLVMRKFRSLNSTMVWFKSGMLPKSKKNSRRSSQFHYGMIQMSKDELIELAKPRVSIPLWYDSNFDIASNSSDDVSVSIPLWYDSNKVKVIDLKGLVPKVSIPLWYDSNIVKRLNCSGSGYQSQFHYGMIQIY